MPTYGPASARAPDLKYVVLPPYEVPDVIVVGGVVVENHGNAPANNVKIVLEYDDADAIRIHHLQVITDVEYILRGGGDRHSFANLRVRRLEPGKRLVIYFSGPRPIQPRVVVTNYEGAT